MRSYLTRILITALLLILSRVFQLELARLTEPRLIANLVTVRLTIGGGGYLLVDFAFVSVGVLRLGVQQALATTNSFEKLLHVVGARSVCLQLRPASDLLLKLFLGENIILAALLIWIVINT